MEKVFQALGDTTRLRILGLLLTGEVCVCHIHESLEDVAAEGLASSGISAPRGLVETPKAGLVVSYRLAESGDSLIRTIRDVVSHALGHLPPIRRDAARLQKKTGCCLPDASSVPTLACCGSDAVR